MSGILPALCREMGYSQTRLERETGIGHSTMQRYWSGDGGLGLKNGRLIANALKVDISRLGLSEEGEAESELVALRRALAALEETVALLVARVQEIEQGPGAAPLDQQAQQPKGDGSR